MQEPFNPRRRFLKTITSGLVAAGTASFASPLFASESTLLPFRRGATLLPLHFNENSLGMSPKALAAGQEAVRIMGNRYADDYCDTLREMLAKQHGVSKSQIVLGNGSTEVINAVVRWLGKSNAVLLEPSPTYSQVSEQFTLAGLDIIQVPTDAKFVTDIAAMRDRAAQIDGPLLINLCNPNNPTGTITPYEILQEWVSSSPSEHVFLIDEAYYDYAAADPAYETALKLIKQQRDNVIVTRTFSKIFGMAGLRMGYGIATEKTAKVVDAHGAGFNLNAAGLAAAIAGLKDESFYQHSLKSNYQAKQILLETLDQLGLEYIPSHTNFVLHRINGPVDIYQQRMKENGILVGRKMTQQDGWNRVSIGVPEQMEAFCKTLKAFREKSWV
ncbi:histidinol-phosphate aminotransferase family protein [Alteromonas aestuariivivens]|uniref:Histidinol-phosphate aminotransferase family protein n=1 Tax=Alteromonas aestuariivivens TaxID=1938339 RepID=A0A3D8M897_9ALTE|nr:histidinol-phosphate transaminase [Alteromonas aestuariivivens]RDV25952.1 histidinol-phosphate aminotransferase family protein [Alteromonas aestuariivivens]